jgi:hypothetical protein
MVRTKIIVKKESKSNEPDYDDGEDKDQLEEMQEEIEQKKTNNGIF